MNILAIRLARLGDVILLQSALNLLKQNFPAATLTLLTDDQCAGLHPLCPAIDDMIPVDRKALRDGPRGFAVKSIRRLLRDIRARRFDLVVDFHSFRETNLLSWLSGAPRRIAMRRFNQSYLSFCFTEPPVPEDKNLHVSDMFVRVAARFGESKMPSNNRLIIPEQIRRWVDSVVPAKPRVALYIDAPIVERTWHPERFAAVADYVIDKWNMDVLVLTGKHGGRLADQLLSVCRLRSRVCAFSELTLPELAGLIGSSGILVSNDTGPMHFGPALGVRTIGLFSVGLPEHFRPTGPNDQFLRAIPIGGISVDDVIQKLEMLRSYS